MQLFGRFVISAFVVLSLHALVPHEGLHEALSSTQSVTVLPGNHLHAAADSGCQFASPTVTPAAIDADCNPIATWNGVPVCTDHNPNVWHPLVKRDASGNVTCTYTHHHGDDPSTVNDLFGSPGAYWGHSGDSFSYPWVTSAAENTDKHNLFKVIVRRDLPQLQAGQNYFKAFRSTTHLLGSGGAIPNSTAHDGFQTQVHSWALEALLCTPDNVCGLLRTGGNQDIGAGFLSQPGTSGSAGEQCVLPNQFSGECAGAIIRHIHGAVGSDRHDFTWYASTRPPYKKTTGYGVNVNFGTIGGEWDQVDPSNYNALPPFDGTDAWLSQEILELYLDQGMPGWDQATNKVTYSGTTDNWGNLVACGSPSATCVPLTITNVPAQSTLYRDSFLVNAGLPSPIKNYDVLVNGLSMTKYPN